MHRWPWLDLTLYVDDRTITHPDPETVVATAAEFLEVSDILGLQDNASNIGITAKHKYVRDRIDEHLTNMTYTVAACNLLSPSRSSDALQDQRFA